MKGLIKKGSAKFYVPDLPAYPYEVLTAFRLSYHLRPASYGRARNQYGEPSNVLAFRNAVGQELIVYDADDTPPFDPDAEVSLDWFPRKRPAVTWETLAKEFVSGLKDAPGKSRWELYQAFANVLRLKPGQYIELDGYTAACANVAGPADWRIIVYTDEETLPDPASVWVVGNFQGRPFIPANTLAMLASKMAQINQDQD